MNVWTMPLLEMFGIYHFENFSNLSFRLVIVFAAATLFGFLPCRELFLRKVQKSRGLDCYVCVRPFSGKKVAFFARVFSFFPFKVVLKGLKKGSFVTSQKPSQVPDKRFAFCPWKWVVRKLFVLFCGRPIAGSVGYIFQVNPLFQAFIASYLGIAQISPFYLWLKAKSLLPLIVIIY
jgi:hypothetical protein